jgi:hypothetical protein
LWIPHILFSAIFGAIYPSGLKDWSSAVESPDLVVRKGNRDEKRCDAEMSKRKGVSFEDKKKAILSIYHEQLVPFNLKEIESIGSRMVC